MLIARAHACTNCGEYSFKRLVVKPVAADDRGVLNEAWRADRVCGVCGHIEEVGIDEDGDIVYVT